MKFHFLASRRKSVLTSAIDKDRRIDHIFGDCSNMYAVDLSAGPSSSMVLGRRVSREALVMPFRTLAAREHTRPTHRR